MKYNLGKVIFCAGNIVFSIASACFTATLLPFMSDQLIGATENELSVVVRLIDH